MEIPKGYEEIKNVTGVYRKDGQIVICGIPDEDNEIHDCDYMGCSSISHVLFRGYYPIEYIGYKEGVPNAD